MKRLNRKYPDDSDHYKSLENLQNLLAYRNLPLQADAPRNDSRETLTCEDEQQLFENAMADVTPISRKNYVSGQFNPRVAGYSDNALLCDETDEAAVACLENLVQYGHGFVVSDTPEYMEGRGYNISPEVTARLHRGDFSIQDHVDLHGLNLAEAREVFDDFLKKSLSLGRQAVLIVHGRGLSSPLQPVLKAGVCRWLTSGQWRRQVIAFTSARSCDGGAGATYVLLRQRPVTRRMRKERNLEL